MICSSNAGNEHANLIQKFYFIILIIENKKIIEILDQKIIIILSLQFSLKSNKNYANNCFLLSPLSGYFSIAIV